VKGLKWFKADGRVKTLRVMRRGRMVALPAAWVVCQRMVGWAGPVCGWGWWSTNPALVAKAMGQQNHVAVRRHQKPPGWRPPKTKARWADL
jgi:hypothetical protein